MFRRDNQFLPFKDQVHMKHKGRPLLSVLYNADKCPTSFSQSQGDQSSIIECDYMDRRYMKKVTSNGTVTLHQRYIYRGYLQIACVDLTRSEHPALWYITWDPTEPIATRPLSIRRNATWYTYSQDLTKNVTELYSPDGTIDSSYDYSPYGAVTVTGSEQPIQWSSECYDPELALTYYNYRHYNPTDGRWLNRDLIQEGGGFNLYGFVKNCPIFKMDYLGQEDEDETCLCFHIVSATVLRTSDKRTRVGGKSLVKHAAKAAAVELLEEIVEKTVSSVAVFGIFGEIALAGGRYIDILYAYRCIKLDTNWTIVVETVISKSGAFTDDSFFTVYQRDAALRAINSKMQDIQTKVKTICQCEE